MNDNQYITKTDLQVFGKELTKELTSNIVNELDQRFDKKFEMAEKHLDKTCAHYYGLIQDDLKSTFEANKDWLMDVPKKVSKLNDKAEENDDEHRDFRVRIGALERSV